jgi:hypothetical protein
MKIAANRSGFAAATSRSHGGFENLLRLFFGLGCVFDQGL